MQIPEPAAWVEIVLRRYARSTNRLLAGRPFGVAGSGPYADALAAALATIGAHVHRVPAGSVDREADATFACEPPAAHEDVFQRAPRVTADERITAAQAHMLVVAEYAGRLAAAGTLRDLRVGVCLVLEPKTAVLVLALQRAGAQVSVYGHPEETDPAVADELRRRGVPVFTASDPDEADGQADAFLAQHLHLLIDDGSRLIRRLAHHPEWATDLIGAAEETTSGLRPLAGLPLSFPVVAVNDAGSKTDFDNAHGTGQSCLFTILDLLAPDGAWPMTGRRVAIAGFGPVGAGLARHARALGALVSIAEHDPVAELRARFAGYPTGDLTTLAAEADLIVSATGYPHTITPEVMAAARKPGAVVAVAGGVDEEVDLAAALAGGATLHPASDKVDLLHLPNGATLRVLDGGGCINCTAGEGNPIEIMDLSFGVQLSALDLLVTNPPPPGVQPLPDAADRAVAATALRAWDRRTR